MGHALLCDFGLSWIREDYTTSSSLQGGPLRYLAPELLMEGITSEEHVYPTEKGDVFSFACTCVQVGGIFTSKLC